MDYNKINEMKEIKSVRLRKTNDNNGVLDIKVTLYEDNHTFGMDERVLVGMNNDYPIWLMCRYKKGGLFMAPRTILKVIPLFILSYNINYFYFVNYKKSVYVGVIK